MHITNTRGFSMGNKLHDSSRLKLKTTDTNRFKVDTGRLKVSPAPAADELSADRMKAGQTQKASDYIDPMSLRDTSTGKLKRVEGVGAASAASGLMPSSASSEKKSETVRLKVVRATPRPGTTPPSSSPPLAKVPLSSPDQTKAAVVAPQDDTIKLQGVQPKAMQKPGATTDISADAEKVQYVEAEAPAEKAAPVTPAVQVTPAASTPASELSSSTIKLSVKKPGPAEASAAAAAVKPAEAPAAAAKPALKIRPVAQEPAKPEAAAEATLTDADSTAVAKSPLDTSGQTIQVAPPSAGETVQVKAPAPKISIKKDAAEAPAASGIKLAVKKDAEEPVTPASETVSVTPPQADDKKKITLPGSAAKTVSVPAPGVKAAEEKKEESAEKVAVESVVQVADDKAGQISTLQFICASVAGLALVAVLYNLVMGMLKHM